MQRNLSVNLGNLLLSLSEITDLANPSIAQHQQRTAFIALELGKAAGLPETIIENIFTAALLHDIGAISVEEKVAIRNFEIKDTDHHCIRFDNYDHIASYVKEEQNSTKEFYERQFAFLVKEI